MRNFLGEKSRINFFSDFFFSKYKLCNVWNWFITKIILISQKYLFWDFSKWQQIKQTAPGLNKGLSSNFLVGKKWKPWEIYRRMYDVYREVCFGLVGFYGISTIIDYLMPNPVYTYIWNKYMICKHILLITFLNEPEFFFALS